MSGQPRSVDQSNRIVPVNLRQSGRTPVELLISTRVRKSPYWHLSHEAGCWRAKRNQLMVMVGMTLSGKPIDDYAPDFWLVSDADGDDPIGYLTSPWYAPELGCNIALG